MPWVEERVAAGGKPRYVALYRDPTGAKRYRFSITHTGDVRPSLLLALVGVAVTEIAQTSDLHY
jgi:hypothetical protein